MKKFLGIIILGLLLSGNAYTHEGEHDPLVCVPESERTLNQRQWSKFLIKNMHKLSKLDQDCLILKVEELEKENEELEKENKELKDKLNQ
jgi:hypothetical protein